MSREGSLNDPERQTGDALDRALRPQAFDDYVGQDALKANLRVYVEAARGRGKPSTMSFCSARRALARRLWPRSCPRSWVSDSDPPPAR